MKKLLFGSVLALTIVVAGCLKEDDPVTTPPCTYDSCAVKAPAAEIQALQTYLDTNNITATQHCSGLFYSIDSVGTGRAARACSGVFVRYKGMLTNGTVFDSTQVEPVGFYLNRVIQGWTNGVPLIKEGGSINLYIPPSLAYGNQPRGPIPANSILIFKVKLEAVVVE